jgi:DhnA family fructose-bisphosphate aldolase class Ia
LRRHGSVERTVDRGIVTNAFETPAKTYRICEILRHDLSVWVDTTIASSVGAPVGLEDIETALERVRGSDAVVVNPGPAERFAGRFGGRGCPGLVMRLDWTNVFRGASHPTPCQEPVYCLIAQPAEALTLGASAVMVTLLLGFDEPFEAENVRHVARFARQASKENVPIAIDVRPLGPRVSDEDLADTALLGASMALEFGADIIVIPYPGEDALHTAASFVSVPMAVDIDAVPRDDRESVVRALSATGVRCVLLREKSFASKDIETEIEQIRSIRPDSAEGTR